MSVHMCKRNFMQMFIRTLFIIAKRCKPPKYPSVDEWINEMWCIHRTDIIWQCKEVKG